MNHRHASDHQGLTRRLLAVGAEAGRRAEAGRVRFAALLLATLTLALALASVVAAHATYEGQEVRGKARGPVFQEDEPDRPAVALWSVTGDSVPGSGQFPVVFLTRLTEDAPLPPGLASWPEPGESVLSPALWDRPGARDLATRYGRTVGTIGSEGLQSPDELFAYVVPFARAEGDGVKPVVGFGPDSGFVYFSVGQQDDAKPEWNFLLMGGFLLVLPAAVLLIVAARAGAHARDRRTALVAVLGASPRSRALIVLGEALFPVLAGALSAALVIATAAVVDIRLPWVRHVLVAADVRAWWWALLAAVLGALLVVLMVVVLTDVTGRRRGSGNRIGGTRRAPVKWAAACPVFILIAVRGPEFFPTGTAPFVFVNWVGAAGALATLPAALAVVIGALGRGLAGVGRRRGRPGLLVAGRRAAAHPGPMARMTAGVVVAIGLLLQAVAWQGQLGSNARAAQATVDRIGTSALVVQPPSATVQQWAAFSRALPTGTAALSLTFEPQAGRTTVTGECPALGSLGLPCASKPKISMSSSADPRLRELLGWSDGGRHTARVVLGAPVTGQGGVRGFTQTVLISPRTGADLSEQRIKQAAYASFPMGAKVSTIGGEWLTAARVNQLQGEWLTLFGLAGIAVLAMASGFAGLAEFLRQGRALAPLATLTGNARVYWSTALHGILLPLALAGLVGSVVGAWLVLPQTASGSSYISDGLLVACAAAAALIGVVGWVWGAVVSVRQAAVWRPRGE
ncbi:ABC transporter permease [Streptomyces filamentosus]|uniref:ABC transporter permease n=1 Tax=Streptomyces filamentosus TaxID=67294 RepID=UPI0036F1701D